MSMHMSMHVCALVAIHAGTASVKCMTLNLCSQAICVLMYPAYVNAATLCCRFVHIIIRQHSSAVYVGMVVVVCML